MSLSERYHARDITYLDLSTDESLDADALTTLKDNRHPDDISQYDPYWGAVELYRLKQVKNEYNRRILMSQRTVSIGADVEAAFVYLGKVNGSNADAYFLQKLDEMGKAALAEADSLRHKAVAEVMSSKMSESEKIVKLREMLG